MTVPAPRRLLRQERALEWRRGHVLDCAERVFARRGFHEATMQEIAREAEYATGTLYTLFDNKEALFTAVVRQRLPEIEAYLRRETERGASPAAKIEHLVRAFFELFETRKDVIQIYVNLTGGFLWNVKAELGEEVSHSHMAFLAFLERIFRDGVRGGEIRPDLDPRLLAVGVIGILTAVATDWITRSPERRFGELLAGTQRLVGAWIVPRRHAATRAVARPRR